MGGEGGIVELGVNRGQTRPVRPDGEHEAALARAAIQCRAKEVSITIQGQILPAIGIDDRIIASVTL
jgi:hypothetical protein